MAAARPRLLRVTYALPRGKVRAAEVRVYVKGRHGPAATLPIAADGWHCIQVVCDGKRLTVRGRR